MQINTCIELNFGLQYFKQNPEMYIIWIYTGYETTIRRVIHISLL